MKKKYFCQSIISVAADSVRIYVDRSAAFLLISYLNVKESMNSRWLEENESFILCVIDWDLLRIIFVLWVRNQKGSGWFSPAKWWFHLIFRNWMKSTVNYFNCRFDVRTCCSNGSVLIRSTLEGKHSIAFVHFTVKFMDAEFLFFYFRLP